MSRSSRNTAPIGLSDWAGYGGYLLLCEVLAIAICAGLPEELPSWNLQSNFFFFLLSAVFCFLVVPTVVAYNLEKGQKNNRRFGLIFSIVQRVSPDLQSQKIFPTIDAALSRYAKQVVGFVGPYFSIIVFFRVLAWISERLCSRIWEDPSGVSLTVQNVIQLMVFYSAAFFIGFAKNNVRLAYVLGLFWPVYALLSQVLGHSFLWGFITCGVLHFLAPIVEKRIVPIAGFLCRFALVAVLFTLSFSLGFGGGWLGIFGGFIFHVTGFYVGTILIWTWKRDKELTVSMALFFPLYSIWLLWGGLIHTILPVVFVFGLFLEGFVFFAVSVLATSLLARTSILERIIQRVKTWREEKRVRKDLKKRTITAEQKAQAEAIATGTELYEKLKSSAGDAKVDHEIEKLRVQGEVKIMALRMEEARAIAKQYSETLKRLEDTPDLPSETRFRILKDLRKRLDLPNEVDPKQDTFVLDPDPSSLDPTDDTAPDMGRRDRQDEASERSALGL